MAAFAKGQYAALDTSVKGVILNQIIQTLTDLALEDIVDEWYFMRQPWVSKIGRYPAGVVSEFRGSLSDKEGVVSLADSRFRYVVAVARAANYAHQEGAELILEWDQAIRRAFRKQHPDWLNAVANVRMVGVTVTEGETFLDEAFRKQCDALYYVVEARVREVLT